VYTLHGSYLNDIKQRVQSLDVAALSSQLSADPDAVIIAHNRDDDKDGAVAL